MMLNKIRDSGSRVQFPAGGLGVAFFATGTGWVLNCISSIIIYVTSSLNLNTKTFRVTIKIV